ncbi:hypothetical protein DFS34DRAFT_712603 [Phlyctochytrium arcticum]|nr:hypothetical protein DFS34DRAFT_712603 [Phlyctochytrium arcticum]
MKVRNPAGKPPKKPILPPDSLSITEQIFFQSASQKPQVIMTFLLRLHLPPSTPKVSLQRLSEILQIAAADHHRLVSYVDPATLTTIPLGKTAADVSHNVRVVDRVDADTWKQVFGQDVNTRFNLNDVKQPLWKTSIIVHPLISGTGSESTMRPADSAIALNDPVEELLRMDLPINAIPQSVVQDAAWSLGPSPESYSPKVVQDASSEWKTSSPLVPSPHREKDPRHFEIIFSFHHCLGDGLSMYAFAQSFLALCTAENFNTDDLKVHEHLLASEPPPLMDNLINPNIFQVLPAMAGLVSALVSGKNRTKYPLRGDSGPILKDGIYMPETQALYTPESQSAKSIPLKISTLQKVTDMPNEQRHKSTTSCRFLWYDAAFVEVLRKRAKEDKTSMAAVLVVAALAAARTAQGSHTEDHSKGSNALPKKQGWVVTSTLRYLLPQSKLLQGGARDSDPAMRLFGGYSGSVSNAAQLGSSDGHGFWDCVRSVRKQVSRSHWSTIGRLKLVNWCFKHQTLWKRINQRTDLSKLSRAFAVEVANLGAWDYPVPSFRSTSSNETTTHATLSHFAGAVNSSFDGVRGLFTLGSITLGGDMSVSISYNREAVSEMEADAFVTSFDRCMRLLPETAGDVTIGWLRRPSPLYR